MLTAQALLTPKVLGEYSLLSLGAPGEHVELGGPGYQPVERLNLLIGRLTGQFISPPSRLWLCAPPGP